MLIYYFNIVVLFGSFVMAVLLFFALFADDSLAYTLPVWAQYVLKAVIISLCIGQLHAMEGDKMNEISLHDLMRDIGQFGLIFFTHLYLNRRRKKRNGAPESA